jgi:hypothetical protein
MKLTLTLVFLLCFVASAGAQQNQAVHKNLSPQTSVVAKDTVKEKKKMQAVQKQAKQKDEVVDLKALERLRATPPSYYFGVSFSNFVPQKEFMDSLRRAYQGVSFFGGYTSQKLHLGLGMQVDLMFTGSDEQRYLMYAVDAFGRRIYYEDTATVQNMLIPITVYGRFNQYFLDFFEPYFEVFGGMNIFSSSMSYNSGLVIQGKQVTDSDSKLNVSFTYGLGAGAMFTLYDYAKLPDNRFKVMLDLRARYYYGGKATYRRGHIIEGSYYFSETTSNTAMVMVHAGLTFQF